MIQKINKNVKSVLYPYKFKTWSFVKVSAADLSPSKQPPIQEIGAMQKGAKIGRCAQRKTKFWVFLGIFLFLLFSTLSIEGMETNASRIEKLEQQIELLQKDLRALSAKQSRPSANPGIMRDEWFAAVEPVYWHQRTNGTAFAYSNTALMTSYPLKGRTKDLHFGWNWGIRVRGGKNIAFDQWDVFASFTYFNNHVSASTRSGQASTLIPLRGSTVVNNGVSHAKSTYDFELCMLDIELGRHYYVSENLSFRPFIGVKNVWIDQAQVIRYTGGSLGVNSAHVNDYCDFWGIGVQSGVNSKWHLDQNFYLGGLLSGAILYGFFDIEHNEKVTPSSNSSIRLDDNKHRFMPTVQWRLGLGYGTYFNQKEYYLDVGIFYEGIYWWRQNQMIKVYEYMALRYDNVSEDVSMHGLTFSARLYF